MTVVFITLFLPPQRTPQLPDKIKINCRLLINSDLQDLIVFSVSDYLSLSNYKKTIPFIHYSFHHPTKPQLFFIDGIEVYFPLNHEKYYE